MSKLDTNFVKQLYSNRGVELTPEKLQYISENYASNEEVESSFNIKYSEPQEPKTDPEKKNQNSTTTSTKTPSVSPTQQRERKPTSVGGKPIQTGASASSAGKSEDLINKFGFKDKEEQKKAGVQASKTKVDVKTPSAIKSVSVKKEQFDKPEIKEAKKEASLFKQEVKREEEKVFVNDFRNATALPENYEQQIIEEVNNEVQGKGVWNAITQGASNVWNKILPYIPGAPSSKEEVEQLKSDVTFLPKAKEEYKKILLKQGAKEDEITDDILTEGAINLEVKKRVEDKKLSLANDYLDNLDNDTKDRMKINSSNQIGIKAPEVNKQFDILKALDLDIKEDNSELVELEKLAKNNGGLSINDLDRYNKLSAELPLKINTRTKLYKNYEKNLSELTTAEEEYDLFKRSYGFEDKAGKLLNAVSDFGLGVLQLANVAKGGPMQDITAMQIAELKNDKDRFVAEKLQKQVKDSKNLNDILDYGSDVLISQTPNIALGYLTGGTSMMYGIGASSAGNKYSELVTSNAEGSTDYSKLQMVLASGLYGASEMLESNTLKMIGGGKSIISKALKNEPSRKLFKESLSTKTFNAGKEFVKNYTGELKEELTTYGAQKITDIVVLDLESKDVFKNAKQEVKSLVKDTGVMVVGLNLFPTAIAKVANAFSPKDYTYNLDKNNKEIEELSKILNNKEASEVVKLEAKSKIDKIVKANEDGLTKIIQNTAKLDDKLIDKVIDIEIASSDLRNKANQINEDKTISKDQKAVLLSGLKDEFIKNESLREDIVSGRKSSFDILPEEEQTKLKVEAAEAIIQEQVDKGIEKDKIQEPNAEVINNKAKELYNQKIQKDAKTKQTDGKITSEEKPTAATKEQTVSTAQQKSNVGLQEEVDKLRVQELNELTENVENPENFITDGKVDAKKVSESDNAKAKEIYAKYDAQIKPLLDNIKTQEDAVQKQITNEGVLQPGQSEMGLQEMEQRDTKQEVVAEQGEEKVNTKISDPYTSIEVDRVKALPVESEDGATMNLDGSKYKDGGLVIPLASKNMNASELTPEAIQSFVDENAESVGADNVKVGIYKFPNSNQVSIDINIVADPSVREEAIAIGKELGQESLFDLDTFENVKTGSDGMNPKKLTPAEFKEIQQRLKPKSKGIEISKDIDQAKKQVANIADKKIAKAVLNGVKAISKILPNVKVIIHDTDDSFRSVSGESKNQESSGLYINGEIHINLPKANKRTVAHEIFHAILLDKVKTDANAQVVTKKMIEAIASKIEGNPTLKAKLEDFASMYDENIQDEEKLAELVGMLAENYESFSTRVKEIIKNWLNSIAKSFGIELFESNEVFDVLNTIAKRVATGGVINESDADIFIKGDVSSVLNVKDSAKPRKSIVGDIIRFDVNKNTEVTENVSLSKFNKKNVNLFESDRMTGGYIKDDSNVVLFKFLGGVQFPVITGKWWASQNETKAKSIANNSNVNRDADGYIYAAPMVGSEKQHMSNNDMLLATTELMKLDATSRNTKVTKSDVIDLINKAFKKKGLESKSPIIKYATKKSNSIEDVFNELEYVLFQDNDNIVDKSGNSILDANGSKISKLNFEERKSIVETLLGNATVRDVNFPSAGNAYDAALRFAEPITQKSKKIGDVVTLMRTKGTLKYKKTDKSDEFYHKSYPYEIYAENEDGSPANIEVFILDNSYSLRDVFPELKKSSGETFTWDEYLEKHGQKSEKFAESQYNRTAKLSSASGNINIRQQKALPAKVAEKLTEDGDGNFVFKHYSNQKRDVIKTGQGNNAITSREEASALSAVGGLAMFYTMEGQKETGVGNVEHNILISKDKVYDIDSDPLGFEGEARKRFNQVRPGQAFTNNHRGAFITQIANENGFDVAVTQWRGSELRAQTTKELTPSDKAIDFKERPLDTFKVGDRAIIDGKESIIESVDGQKIGYKSIDGTSQGVTINNERNRRSIIKIEPETSVRKQKPSKQELSDAKKEIQEVFSAAKEALKIEKDRNKVINRLKVDANAFIKASITDLKAGDIGNRAITSIASKIQSITDQNFEEKLLEINTVLDNLYTNRDVNTAKADSKKAFKNVMSGKVGKLDERGDRDKVMSSKVVNFTKLEPKTLKKVLDDADFEQYKDYIGRLSGKGLTLSETDLKTIGELYDKISKPYSDYVSEVNRIQQIIDAGGTLTKDESDFIENNSSDFSERETPETLADKEAKKLERDAKKEAEIAKKKASIKELLPSIKSVFESSNATKGSLEWRMLNSLIGLSESDVDSMPDNMLTNALNAISSMVYDDVITAYTEDLYKYKLKTDYKNALVETLKKSGKAGVYKLKVAKIPLKLREIIGLPLMSLTKGINQKNIDQQVIDRRIKFFNLSAMDAAVKVYGDTPLFNAFMSSFGKAMSRIASTEEKVESVLLRAKRDLDKNSKNPQESYMKIVYHLIDTMAKNNVGTTSSRSAMEYFEATVNDTNSKISEDNYMKGLVNGFIDKVKGNDNQIDDLTPEEANAANAIRMVLEENQINAYEANLFQNSNAAPMIVEYYPVFNSVVKQAENDLARLKSKFGIDSVSIKAGNLEDKTGTAHPIDLNPFTSAFSSVRNVLFQHQLRSEYAAITQAINEAIAENSKDNDALPYLKGIQKALNSQFDLLINGAIHAEPTLTDKILNGTDRAFYTLALGSIISRGVDFAGNMVQLMTINPKYISYSNKMSNALINIKEDGESETELIRSFYENAEASDVNKMISSKKINTERTEFINRGINKEVLSKGLPESNTGVKLRAKITGPIRDTASGAVDTLLGFGDVKPYAISWNGVFYEEFLKQTGEDVNVEKIARGDVEYLKKYKDAISKASNKANQENADLYGSTNPMEKKVGIMEIASKQVKNSVPGAVNALVNKAAYLFSSFDMNARNDINTAVNTYIENQEGRNARRFLGGAIRLASYSLAINYITGAIWGLFKGDDDDEEKLKVSFDKLSGDDDFIKEVNNSLLDYPIQKDADGNIIELTREDLVKYNKMRDKLMQNKDFAAAYDIVYGYVNRDLFDNQVKNKIGEINSGKYEYDKSLVEVFFSDMDKGFGKSDDEIIGVLGLLNSQQGYKLFTQDQIDSYILKLEKYMSDTKFLSNRAIRESNKQIDRLIITKTASILSDYRSNKSIGDITTTEGLKLFMGMMLSRSNNFTKAAYNYAAELSNKQLIQARRGERGYDAFKDNVFQTPVKAGLTEKASKQQLTQDVFNILFPALTKMDRYMATDYAIPDLVRFTPLGILGVNDFSKIDSKMRNDVIYQNTNGKYRENIIKDIEESKIDILRSKEDIEKDSTDNQFRKSRVIPGVKETQLKSRFPSYKEGKDLKVNGNRAN